MVELSRLPCCARGRVCIRTSVKCNCRRERQLVPHNDERRGVPGHLAKLDLGDLVIFDRDYFSYLMLHQVLASGQYAVFRLQQGTTNSQVVAFWESDRKDAIIEYVPSTAVKHGLRKRGHTSGFQRRCCINGI